MKALILVKSLVILLGVGILAAFSFVVFKITNNPPKIKQNLPVSVAAPATPTPITGLTFGETVQQMTSCAPYVCVLTQKTDGARVLVLDVTNGTIIQSIELKQP